MYVALKFYHAFPNSLVILTNVFIRVFPKCEVRYGPTLAQHRQQFSEDWLPKSCRCWNDNPSMHLAANSGPNSGRQHLFSAQQRANAVPNSGFLTSRMVCHGKSDTWPSNELDSGSFTFATGCHSKRDNRLGIGPTLGQVSAEGR